MATTKATNGSGRRLLIAAVAAATAAAIWWSGLFARPPQMGADEGVFKTVDALFTALNAHDDKLVFQCQQRLLAMKNEGKLPAEAASYLDDIIATSRNGQWEPAAQSLYRFMEIQRRDARQSRKKVVNSS